MNIFVDGRFLSEYFDFGDSCEIFSFSENNFDSIFCKNKSDNNIIVCGYEFLITKETKFSQSDELILVSSKPVSNTILTGISKYMKIIDYILYNNIEDVTECIKNKLFIRILNSKKMNYDKDFLAKLSHEIRTPLNSIVGATDLLKGAKLSSENKRMLELIDKSSQYLLVFLSNFLELSVDNNKPEEILEKVQFFGLLNEVSSFAELFANNKDIKIYVDNDQRINENIYSYTVKLKQILFNLINNSIKFTESGSITIKTKLQKRVGKLQKITVSVIDTGRGFVAKDVNKVFNHYYQSNHEDRHIGAGLGLGICMNLASSLDGDMSIDLNYTDGAKIDFTFSCNSFGDILLPNFKNLSVFSEYNDFKTKNIIRDIVESRSGKIYGSSEKAQLFVHTLDQDNSYNILRCIEQNPRGRHLVMHSFSTDKKDRFSVHDNVSLVNLPFTSTKFDNFVLNTDLMNQANVNINYTFDNELKILYVDDEPDNRYIIENYLDKTPHTLKAVQSADVALDLLTNNQFDLVFMDLRMPLKNGYEAFDAIKKDKLTDSPVYALTANAFQSDIDKVKRSGFSGFVRKPLKKIHLYNFLDNFDPNNSKDFVVV